MVGSMRSDICRRMSACLLRKSQSFKHCSRPPKSYFFLPTYHMFSLFSQVRNRKTIVISSESTLVIDVIGFLKFLVSYPIFSLKSPLHHGWSSLRLAVHPSDPKAPHAAGAAPSGKPYLWPKWWWFMGISIRKMMIWLVVSTPLKNISQLGWLFPIYAKIINVPNHQPDGDFNKKK